MKRLSVRSLSSLVAMGLVGAAATNCAESSETSSSTPPPSTVIPDASGDAVDAGSDLDGAHVVSCDEVDWCAVTSGVSAPLVLTSIWGAAANDLWIGGSGGTLVHFDGATWTPATTNVWNTFNAVWGSGPNDIYAASSTDVLLHSTGAGAPWTPVALPLAPEAEARISALWGSSADDVRIGGAPFPVFDSNGWFAGNGNQLVKSATQGGTEPWSAVLGDATVLAIWGSSANDVWISLDNTVWFDKFWQYGLTIHGTRAEGGELTFVEVDSQSATRIVAMHGSSADDVWAVGAQGTIRHMTPGNVRWQVVPSPTTANLNAVWANAPNDVWVAGDDGTILHFDGTSFTPSSAQLPNGGKPKLRGIWGSGPNDVWIVGGDTVLHFTGAKNNKSGTSP